ncbi:MAG: IclR family transcriptional regulator [Thiotrichales bacterium]
MKSTSIQVIDRLVWLLDVLARYEHPVSLKVLAAETGLAPSTGFRILAAAVEHGLVERDPSGAYRLGGKLLQLAAHVHGHTDLIGLARPFMERLRDQTGETVNLTFREGDQVVYVERVLSQRMMRVEQIVGSRAPLHVTAVGKLMLAESGREATEDYARRTGLPAYTRHTLNELEALWRAVTRDRDHGFAYDNEEAEPGVGCIGALVHDAAGRVAAGLSISAPIERRQDTWIPWVRESARLISARLGFVAS